MHRDILNYGRDAKPLGDEISFSRHGEIYMPIFDKYDVDAVLTAHLHTYRRRALIRDFAQNEQEHCIYLQAWQVMYVIQVYGIKST